MQTKQFFFMASNCQPIDVGTRLSNPIAIYFAWAWAKSAMRHGIQKKKKKKDTKTQQSNSLPTRTPTPPSHTICCQAVATSLGLHSQSFFTFAMRKSRSLHRSVFWISVRSIAPARLEAEAGHLWRGLSCWPQPRIYRISKSGGPER